MDIKGVIKAHGYTLIDVANKMEITKGGISQIVNGSPNVKTLRTIASWSPLKVSNPKYLFSCSVRLTLLLIYYVPL